MGRCWWGKIMAQKKQKKKSSSDFLINILCLLILFGFVYNEFSYAFAQKTPIKEKTNLFERHVTQGSAFPFLTPYYLLKPESYDPKIPYPVVVVLYGASGNAYPAYALSSSEFRNRYPAFVLVPIAPKRSYWSRPKDLTSIGLPRSLNYPDFMPNVIAAISDAANRYSIDKNRIYLTGQSLGGMGTIGGMIHYPDLFAAGIVTAGIWNVRDAPLLKNQKIAICHAADDNGYPVRMARRLVDGIRYAGGHPNYFEMPQGGHGACLSVYQNKPLWDWLFAQHKPYTHR
jgi:predicted peptidase